MRKLRYHLVDVFTDRIFGGNPLAVFTNGRGLPAEVMQAIAKELNLPETTFVLPPEKPGHDNRVRIEPGRPSFIKINVEHEGREITSVKVGGQCGYVGEGFLELSA